jgi:hypothetical protein
MISSSPAPVTVTLSSVDFTPKKHDIRSLVPYFGVSEHDVARVKVQVTVPCGPSQANIYFSNARLD